MRTRFAFAVILTLYAPMALAACSEDKSATPGPTSAVSPSTPPPPSSTPPPTSVATSPAPTTSLVASTSTDAAPSTDSTTTVDQEAGVRRALQDYLESYIACGQSPAACKPESFLAPNSEALANVSRFVADLLSHDYRVSADTRGTRIVPINVNASGDRATATACWFDGLVALGPNGPDGNPTIANDQSRTRHSLHEFQLIDGRWLLAKSTTLEKLGTEDECG